MVSMISFGLISLLFFNKGNYDLVTDLFIVDAFLFSLPKIIIERTFKYSKTLAITTSISVLLKLIVMIVYY